MNNYLRTLLKIYLYVIINHIPVLMKYYEYDEIKFYAYVSLMYINVS